jgi:hypothetical protein
MRSSRSKEIGDNHEGDHRGDESPVERLESGRVDESALLAPKRFIGKEPQKTLEIQGVFFKVDFFTIQRC